MNTLDELLAGRVRSAMHATAEEIGPDEVPPLGSRARQFTITTLGDAGRPGGGRRSGGRWARWGVPLAAAATVLAVVAAGLGTGVIPGGGPRSDGAGPVTETAPGGNTTAPGLNTTAPGSTIAPGGAPPYGSVAKLTSGLVSLYLTASGAQFAAGDQFAAMYGGMENAIVLRCLAGRGFPLPAGTDVAASSTAGDGGDLAQFPDLASIARAGTLLGGGPYRGPGRIPTTAAYGKALSVCTQPARDPFSAMNTYGLNLGANFLAMVTAIQTSAPVKATIPALRACAARYGWPRDGQGKNQPLYSFGDFVTWVESFFKGPSAGQSPSAATRTALGKQWGPRFVECARPTVSVMEKLQLAAQRIYLTAYGARLTRLVGLAEHAFSVAQAASGN
jgi:hypothetical protein